MHFGAATLIFPAKPVIDKGWAHKETRPFCCQIEMDFENDMKQSGIERRIADLIEPVIKDKGYDLVCLSLMGQELQIMAENPQTRNLGVDDCALLSREISTILEVEDPIKGHYRLEVSSPGIDRPLVKLQDFADFVDQEAKIEISPPLEGQKRFRGFLRGIEKKNEDDEILLETDTGMVHLSFHAIEKAKLVLTSKLLKKKISKEEDLITNEHQIEN